MKYLNAFLCSFVYLALNSTPLLAQSNVILDCQPVFQQPSVGFVTADPFTPVRYLNGSVYYVWVDSSFVPWVTKITDGQAVNVKLETRPYNVQPDGHQRFSLGIDKKGYIHVSGDMHNYDALTDQVINPYPTFLQKQQILYWKSNQPESVADGFVFAGGLNKTTLKPGTKDVYIEPTTAPSVPGSGWTYQRFFNDNNGELYLSALMHPAAYGFFPGAMGVGLYKYNVNTKQWTAIGGLVNTISTATLYNVTFYWEQTGFAPDVWFQGYRPNFFFDKNNHMHFTVSGNTNNAYSQNNRVIYAVSKDGGKTWSKANGTKIPGLPIRGADGQANLGDVVVDDATIPDFDANTAVVYDKNGKLSVYGGKSWWQWNGYSWVNDAVMALTKLPATYATNGLNNQILYTNGNMAKVFWAPVLDTIPSAYDLSKGVGYPSYGSIQGIDQYTYRKTGMIYGVGTGSDGISQTVVKTTITSAPLPKGWTNVDVAATPPSYASSAGYQNGVFSLVDFGSSIGDTSDSFEFLYQKMSGNCTLIARVNSAQPSADGYARAGIMMRENVSDGSKNVAMILAPGNNSQGAIFQYRSTTGGASGGISTPNNVNPYWVKLVRAGNVFTGYISADGNTWKQSGQTTVAMNAKILVGLANCGYANGWYMVQTTYDNVSLTQQ